LPRAKLDTNRVDLLKDICIAYYGYGNSISGLTTVYWRFS
jgi:hypothetical protein